MEIYNESVRDLLSADSTNLRLLDDPEVNIIFDMLSTVEVRFFALTICYLDREGLLLRDLQRKRSGTGTILKNFYLSVKVSNEDASN